MVKQLYTTPFKSIGNGCNSCFLFNEESGKKQQSGLVREGLIDITLSSDDKKRSIAEEALNRCNACDYKEPYVFNFLDKMGIRF